MNSTLDITWILGLKKKNHYKSNEPAEIKKYLVFNKVLECGSDNDRNWKNPINSCYCYYSGFDIIKSQSKLTWTIIF